MRFVNLDSKDAIHYLKGQFSQEGVGALLSILSTIHKTHFNMRKGRKRSTKDPLKAGVRHLSHVM